MMNAAVINMSEMDLVVGGTFTSNKYSKEEYHNSGVSTNYHFFKKDEFYIKNEQCQDVKISYEMANFAVFLSKNFHIPMTYEDITADKLSYNGLTINVKYFREEC